MTKNTFRWECHYHKNTGILNIKYSNLAEISEYKKKILVNLTVLSITVIISIKPLR